MARRAFSILKAAFLASSSASGSGGGVSAWVGEVRSAAFVPASAGFSSTLGSAVSAGMGRPFSGSGGSG